MRTQSPPGPGQSTPARELTLNQCYSLALSASEDDRIRAADMAAAQARYRQSVGGIFPRAALFLNKTYEDREDENRIGATNRGLLGQGRPAGLSFENPLRAGLSVSWPLFAGFRSYYEAEAGEFDLRRLTLERRRFRELLYQDVADVYYQVLQYEAAEKILGDQTRALNARIGELRRRVRIGRSRQGELLSARSDTADSHVEREENRALLLASRELLAFLTGRPELRADTGNEALAPAQKLPATEELTAYLKTTGERADVLAAAQAIRRERLALRAANTAALPEVTLEGQALAVQQPDTGRDWNIQLRIELPIFEGGRIRAQVTEAEALLRGSRLNLQRLRRTADFETRMSYNDFLSASARVLLLRESVRLARASYGIHLRDYRLGIVTNLEVLEALRRLHLARLGLARTELLAATTQVRLHIAAGRAAPDSERTEAERTDRAERAPQEAGS